MQRKILKSNGGFTLIETVTVLAIMAVLSAVFYLVFMTNAVAFDDRLARANMWQQANEIMETLTADGRLSQDITVVVNGDGSQSAQLVDGLSQPLATYTITVDGRLTQLKNGVTKVLSDKINVAQSNFVEQGEGLRFQLAMQEPLFRRVANIQTSTEVYPRN